MRQFGVWVGKHSLKDFRALVKLVETMLAKCEDLGVAVESHSVLNKYLFELFDQLVGSSAAVCEVTKDLGHLVKCEVFQEPLIDKL